MIRQATDPLRTAAERVVRLAAPHIRKRETAAELHAFDSGDGEERMGEHPFQGVKPGFAYASRKTGHGGFQDSADAVAFCSRGFDGGLHLPPL